jgi:hypothetical protein
LCRRWGWAINTYNPNLLPPPPTMATNDAHVNNVDTVPSSFVSAFLNSESNMESLINATVDIRAHESYSQLIVDGFAAELDLLASINKNHNDVFFIRSSGQIKNVNNINNNSKNHDNGSNN